MLVRFALAGSARTRMSRLEQADVESLVGFKMEKADPEKLGIGFFSIYRASQGLAIAARTSTAVITAWAAISAAAAWSCSAGRWRKEDFA